MKDIQSLSFFTILLRLIYASSHNALLSVDGKALHCLWWGWMLTSALSDGLCNPPESSQEGQRVLVPPQTLCWWKWTPFPSSTPFLCESVCLSQTQTHTQTKQTESSRDVSASTRSNNVWTKFTSRDKTGFNKRIQITLTNQNKCD